MIASSALIILLVATVPLCGCLLACTPWLEPSDQCFAVTLPEKARQDAQFAILRRRFTVAVASSTAICTLIASVAAIMLTPSRHEIVFMLIFCLCVLMPVGIGFPLMLRYRKRVQTIKRAEKWQAATQLHAAIISQDAPRQIPLIWNLLYLPVFALSAAFVFVLYPSMPAALPLKTDLAGIILQTTAKNPLTASLPLFIELFLAACFIFSHWSMLRSKKPIKANAPATSAYAYGIFMNVMCVLMLGGGLLLCISIGACFPLSCVGIISPLQAAFIIVLVGLFFALAAATASLLLGQSGSKLFAAAMSENAMTSDDDCFWKLGIFYVNSNDASIFAPKRFGVGWTVNLGRPAAWLIIAAFLAFIALFCLIIYGLIG